MMLNRQS